MSDKSLDDEIAFLRAVIHKNAEDPALVLRAVNLLARAVAAQYGLSKEEERKLGQDILDTLSKIGK